MGAQAINHTSDISCVDAFAGQANISRAFLAKNLKVHTLDIALDPTDEPLRSFEGCRG